MITMLTIVWSFYYLGNGLPQLTTTHLEFPTQKDCEDWLDKAEKDDRLQVARDKMSCMIGQDPAEQVQIVTPPIRDNPHR